MKLQEEQVVYASIHLLLDQFSERQWCSCCQYQNDCRLEVWDDFSESPLWIGFYLYLMPFIKKLWQKVFFCSRQDFLQLHNQNNLGKCIFLLDSTDICTRRASLICKFHNLLNLFLWDSVTKTFICYLNCTTFRFHLRESELLARFPKASSLH